MHLSNFMGASSMPVLFKRPVLNDEDNKIIDEREHSRDGGGNVETILSSLDLSNENDEDHLISFVVEDLDPPLPAPLKLNHSSDLIIAGHCDGIICLKLFTGNAILWNPAMKESKLLPKSLLLLPNDDDELLNYELGSYTDNLGFGYDPKGKDYKVVRFVTYNEEYYWFRAEVYSMDSNSWREINTPYDEMTTRAVFQSTNDLSVYFNGICYWQVLGRIPDVEVFLLSFDMGNELFNEIPFPELPDGCRVTTLAIWKEFIVLFTYQEGIGIPQCYDMWVMMDDPGDGKGPWTKHLTIGPVECDGCPLLFHNNCNLFMINNNDGHIVSYNIGTTILKYLPIQFIGYIFYNQALVYRNTIVSIKGGNVLDDIHISAFYGNGMFQSGYRGKVDISTFQDIEKSEL
ncbi:F-box/kelch-repeat protein At3g06240-like [Argentina anserina]|uniref:F-box/kelch-repeat protein At3g06240-like n=1 Tax=Argentina anserina TaxID=57926 RepID=UPI0021764066|nr:F-box/kelch-repeat protein At3g06240-like [Potentilla anserina]